ncbi:hypothetical protein HO133_006439 [Letharia lupina]|uniref:Uncharacterized protein n=1 Tax=Letharia lupina TaxID=560253 RepID=A0A8H6C6T7_9LECA|nr:uncharacterized protein HO133_006439 [Letharia lupina]KAF6218027.1 hypothetical protein HO133_006439 [Letharia lupina]
MAPAAMADLDDEDAKGIDADADNADDPMNVAVCGPTEEEQANWEKEGAVQSRQKALFRRAKAIGFDIGFEYEI